MGQSDVPARAERRFVAAWVGGIMFALGGVFGAFTNWWEPVVVGAVVILVGVARLVLEFLTWSRS